MATKMASKARPATRHVISINDLSDKDIETIFDTAQTYLKELPDLNVPYRIGRSTNVASNFILASLFYEPSTRTRLSFESAMIRLGGQTITSADPATSSAAKGESLADSVRVIANYADIMVIRHPRDGAARLAAEYSPIPVINGGDGSPRASDPDAVRPVHAQAEEQAPQEPEGRDLRRPQGLAHHPFLRLCAGALRRDHHADAGQGHGAARPCRPAPARGIPLPHGAGAERQGRRRRRDRRPLRDARGAAPAVAVLRSGDRAATSAATSGWSTRRSTRSTSPASRRSAGPTRTRPIRASTANSSTSRNTPTRA